MRSRGSSSWIRFRNVSLSQLLEGLEACSNKVDGKEFCKVWKEGGRAFKMESRSNGARRFIQCSVKSVEAKRFILIFPEGRGVVGGWSILAKKLKDLVVASFSYFQRGREDAPKIRGGK